MLEHGGRLRAAARKWNIPLKYWVVLSTAIAPWSFPLPPLPPQCWQRLPEEEDSLAAAARDYYSAPRVLPIPGAQAAVQTLPRLRPPGKIAVLQPSFSEHQAAWAGAGHQLTPFAADALDAVCAAAAVVVVCNPNSPDGHRFAPDQLLAAARSLSQRQGWLVVDESLIDAEAASLSLASLAGSPGLEGLIVLRSLSKFFGLAGARVGFALGHDQVLDALDQAIGPWAVAHPSRQVASAALMDREWQASQRQRVTQAGDLLDRLLASRGLPHSRGTALFRSVVTARAEELHAALARQGILVRLFAPLNILRFGLPPSEPAWLRLELALRNLTGSGAL